jgi:hypothetical protein
MGEFRLLMLSAMYENGGNVTHRLFDGHPRMFVYPFESQLGTHLVSDHLSSMFPSKYRWPVFASDATPYQDYASIIDEECKVRARTPDVSKFRKLRFDFNDDERCKLYAEYVNETGRSRPNNIAAFFRATLDAWKNYRSSGTPELYVGYSPVIVVDAGTILEEMPLSHVLHVVRNPWSAYADTKKRAVPLSLERYMADWVTVQHHALVFQRLYPDRVHVLRYEDIIEKPEAVLGEVCKNAGLAPSVTLKTPTWNGAPLKEIYPWGTIRTATPDANIATANGLSSGERDAVRAWAQHYLENFRYKDLI